MKIRSARTGWVSRNTASGERYRPLKRISAEEKINIANSDVKKTLNSVGTIWTSPAKNWKHSRNNQ
jgi:hypothetical protein